MNDYRIELTNSWQDLLTGVARRQIPFAIAQALNAVAFDARDRVIAELPSRFTIRSGRFLPGSIRVQRATKQTRRAVVGVDERAAFMLKQEDGGTMGPAQGRRVVSVPTGRLAGRKITKGNRPSALLDKPNAFIMHTSRGDVIAQRMSRRNVQIMWGFEQETHYQERFEFRDTVEREAASKYQDAMYAALLRALG